MRSIDFCPSNSGKKALVPENELVEIDGTVIDEKKALLPVICGIVKELKNPEFPLKELKYPSDPVMVLT